MTAWVTAHGGPGIPLQISNLSAGGALLLGDAFLKSTLYRRKNKYTHRPVRVQIELELGDGSDAFYVDGLGVFLRRLAPEQYQVGLKFLQETPQFRLINYLSEFDGRYSALVFPDTVRALPC